MKKLRKNSNFVVFLSTIFSNVSAITAVRLLEVCSVEYLRSHTSVIGYLAMYHQVIFSFEEKINSSESLQISKKLSSLSGKSYEADLLQYHDWLISTNSRKLKTIRMYLQAAIQFIERCGVDMVSNLPDCDKMQWVIRQYPSQYASLTVFSTWCRESFGIHLPFKKPLPRTSSLERSIILTERANTSLRLAQTETSLARKKSALAHLLNLLYGVKHSSVMQTKRNDFEQREKHLVWLIDHDEIVLDSRVARIISSVIEVDIVSDFLFPGRIAKHSMVVPSYSLSS